MRPKFDKNDIQYPDILPHHNKPLGQLAQQCKNEPFAPIDSMSQEIRQTVVRLLQEVVRTGSCVSSRLVSESVKETE